MAFTLEQNALIQKTKATVAEYMSTNDPSHDWNHIKHVLDNALHLYEVEAATHPEIRYNKLIITLAALIHDIGDHKYPKPGQTPEEEKVAGQTMLIRNGADPLLAETVQKIASAVSYTQECAHPERMYQVLKEHPELAIVQDADRLDALGPRGVARILFYNGAHPYPGVTMEAALADNKAKLINFPKMMKTDEGRRMAPPGLKFVLDFMTAWDRQVDLKGTGERAYDWDSGSYGL